MFTWEALHSIAVGGVAAHVSELGAALVRQGHEVHVFTRSGHGQRTHERIDGVHYHRCIHTGQKDFVDDINSMCRALVERFFVIEDFHGAFDIVHAHDWLAANAMIWIKQGRGYHRCIFTVHSTEYGRCGNAFRNGASNRIRFQERAGTYWADQVIAVSHATRDEITWMYEVPERKTHVVYNGVTPQRFAQPLDCGEFKHRFHIAPLDPLVLFCGRLAWQKGPDLLVEAIPAVLRRFGAAKFVFAGDGDMRGGLEQRARQLGVTHATRFIGHRSGDDLIHLFQAADTLCVPSRNEPFGIVVLEAWSAGKPVVVTQVGGPNEYVSHEVNGLKIQPRPDSVIWGLTTLLSNFDHARRMGQHGRREVEARFTWDRIARQTLGVYDPGGSILQNARPHKHEPLALTWKNAPEAPTDDAPHRPAGVEPVRPSAAEETLRRPDAPTHLALVP